MMQMRDKTLIVLLVGGAIAALLFTSNPGARAAERADVRIGMDKASVCVSLGDKEILNYRFKGGKKPYVDRLFSPSGIEVLRDAPADHLHHHGLMYAAAIDGVNFWEENEPEFGSQQGRPPRIVERVLRTGLVQEIKWLKPQSEKPLMIERRAVDVLKAADLGATLIEWQCRFEAPPDKKSITFSGSHYHGLGMRFVPSMDHGGHFIYADDQTPIPFQPAGAAGPEKNTWLTPVRWCAYTAKAGGRPVTVAMFDDARNFRHPATMFTLAAHFAYISATLNQQKQPLKIKAGFPLELCYAVAVWDGQQDRPTIEKLYQRWLSFRAHEPENFYDDVRQPRPRR
jgi:hypothetical protein